MPWLFAAVVLVCAILFPRFRKVLLGIVVLLGLVGAAYYVWQSFEESASKRRIGLPEIELTDVQFRDNGFDGYTIIGRARNRSVRYTLSGLTIRTVLEDCLNETNCDVVFEHDERSSILFRVPPGQARDFEINGIRDHIRPKGTLRWSYRLLQTYGQR